MPAKDFFHQAVTQGLEKEGWVITDDPFRLKVGDVEMYIDIGAEKLVAAEKNGEKIAVEIKSFMGASNISNFHTAIGQFLNYRVALEAQEPERKLYLAVPISVYNVFFKLGFIQTVTQRFHVKLTIYDPVQEEIVAWEN